MNFKHSETGAFFMPERKLKISEYHITTKLHIEKIVKCNKNMGLIEVVVCVYRTMET